MKFDVTNSQTKDGNHLEEFNIFTDCGMCISIHHLDLTDCGMCISMLATRHHFEKNEKTFKRIVLECCTICL